MKTTHNTVLITGGSAGIGFEMAKQFLESGNKVIITGRDENRLKNALAALPNATGFVCDVTSSGDVHQLVQRLEADFPGLNIVINNAGKAYTHDLSNGQDVFEKAQEELLTNYLSIARLNEWLLPVLKTKPEAAIVNVSSVLGLVPSANVPNYSASKAAVHSYTQSLRFSLAGIGIHVFEVMPPLVNTEFSKDIGGSKGIAPSVVASDLLQAMAENRYEVHVGVTAQLYQLALSSPSQAFATLNAQ